MVFEMGKNKKAGGRMEILFNRTRRRSAVGLEWAYLRIWLAVEADDITLKSLEIVVLGRILSCHKSCTAIRVDYSWSNFFTIVKIVASATV